MNQTKLYVTKEGLAKLKLEYKELTEVKRAEVAQRLKDAREMGDLSENAEYDSARQAQSFIEGRIAELEEVLKTVKVSENKDKDKVSVGTKVKVYIEGSEEHFMIVGAAESNPVEGKISNESPLGNALMGKKIGDKVSVNAPVGTLTYTILHIE